MSRPIKTSGFSLRLLPEDRAKLDALAEQQQISAGEMLIRLIRDAHKKQQKKQAGEQAE